MPTYKASKKAVSITKQLLHMLNKINKDKQQIRQIDRKEKPHEIIP